jgi:hypothetical protein
VNTVKPILQLENWNAEVVNKNITMVIVYDVYPEKICDTYMLQIIITKILPAPVGVSAA